MTVPFHSSLSNPKTSPFLKQGLVSWLEPEALNGTHQGAKISFKINTSKQRKQSRTLFPFQRTRDTAGKNLVCVSFLMDCNLQARLKGWLYLVKRVAIRRQVLPWFTNSVLTWTCRGTFDQLPERASRASRLGSGNFKRTVKQTLISAFLFLRLPTGFT